MLNNAASHYSNPLSTYVWIKQYTSGFTCYNKEAIIAMQQDNVV